MKKCIMIIFGGDSSEYEVSCVSAAGIAKNINHKKYKCLMVGITKDGQWLLTDADTNSIESGKWINEKNIDVTLSLNKKYPGLIIIDNNKMRYITVDAIFPILHGKNGEDGSIQGIMQLSGIPYIGCNIQSSVIGFDKALTKEIVNSIGINQAQSLTIYNHDPIDIDSIDEYFHSRYPLFVKPAREGSSIGISKVKNYEKLRKAIEIGFKYDNKLVIEEGIIGREIEIAILGNGDSVIVSPVGEIVVNDEFYSYEAKYKSGTSETRIAEDIPDNVVANIKESAIKIYKKLECKDMARIDFFLKDDKTVIFNEINTMPGFTPISMYPKLWESYGIGYSSLISKLIEDTLNEIET